MTDKTTEIIFHHYDISPFSEKVRLVFGLKGLKWNSVIINWIMPKPELTPMTGGYRRTPVMQIGAEVFCDSQIIIRELERRFPTPTVLPGGNKGAPYALGMWTDRMFFQACVAVIFGGPMGDEVPDDFIKDREKLAGATFDMKAMKEAAPLMQDQLRAHAGWIDDQLADGRPFLFGDEPGLADFNPYMPVWFLRNAHGEAAKKIFGEFANLEAWEARVAAIGHGERIEMDPKEALSVAKATEPPATSATDAFDTHGRTPGTRVAVMADDYGRDPIVGELLHSSAQHIAIKRADPACGEVIVWFPRAGYLVAPA